MIFVPTYFLDARAPTAPLLLMLLSVCCKFNNTFYFYNKKECWYSFCATTASGNGVSFVLNKQSVKEGKYVINDALVSVRIDIVA